MRAISLFLITSVGVVFISTTAMPQAKSTFGKPRSALRGGMSIDDALAVALRCVKEATGYKTSSEYSRVKLYRSEDTLAALGISSTDRLNALRRYLVRNEELGVNSVFDLTPPVDAAFHTNRYMISRNDLVDMKTDWTLLKLAQRIQQKSGMPRLPTSSAAQIVADCRIYPDGRKPEDATVLGFPQDPNKPDPKVKAGLGTVVKGDGIDTDGEVFAFAKCIAGDGPYGIETVEMETPEDEAASYFLRVDDSTGDDRRAAASEFFVKAVRDKDWTYGCLVEFIRENAQIALPKRTVASGIAISNIYGVIGRGNQFDKNTKLGSIMTANQIDDLKDKIARNMEYRSLIKPSACELPEGPSYVSLNKIAVSEVRTILRSYQGDSLEDVSANTTVGELIGIVLERVDRIESAR